MALVKCRECGSQVSNKAETCPSCGVTIKAKPTQYGCGTLILIGVVIFIWVGVFTDNSPPSGSSQVSSSETKAKPAPCTTDACIADEYMSWAAGPCKRSIERHAKHQAEWLDGWTTPLFTKYLVDESNKSQITYIGDQVKFQNGFGAWTRMTYLCTYDTKRKAVTNVLIEEGRL